MSREQINRMNKVGRSATAGIQSLHRFIGASGRSKENLLGEILLYMDGRSFLQIKCSLEAYGVLNGAGNAKWHESNIKQILTNEKYIGDTLL